MNAAIVQQDCTTDDVCGHLKVCNMTTHACEHKEFWPLSPYEYLAGILMFIVSAMANSAGITGCSMMIPILIIIGGFTTHWAIPIVQLVAFAGVFNAILYRFTMRHPTRDRPRIDFNLAMHICMPMLLGTCYGVIVNALLPDWFILICLTLSFAFGSLGSLQKARAISKKEDEDIRQAAASKKEGLLEKPYRYDADPNHSEEIKAIIQEEARYFPPVQMGMILIEYGFMMLFAFARGGKGLKSFFGIEPCSSAYWWFTIGYSICCLGIICASAYILIWKYKRYEDAKYKFEDDDMKWTSYTSNRVIAVALFTGLVCGCLGLTGGVFLGPVLLWLGVKTETSTATCSFVVSFSSSVAFVQYAAAGMVKYAYGVWYATWAGAGALIGVAILEKIMKKSGKASPSVYILALVLGMATILVPVYGIARVVDLVNQGKFSFGFRQFC